MTRIANLQRRAALRAALGITLGSAAPVWAQSPATRGICVAQIVDTSSSQIDVSKDFLVGSRTAWLDINYRGGLQGKAVRHRVLEVNDNAAGLRAAVDTLGDDPHCLAIFGSVGDRTASQLVGILDRELPDMPHVAPWLHNVDELELSNTFPIFASRQTQIAHAIKSLSIMGITKVGAIYGLALEYAAYRRNSASPFSPTRRRWTCVTWPKPLPPKVRACYCSLAERRSWCVFHKVSRAARYSVTSLPCPTSTCKASNNWACPGTRP